eukprot:CAMPEP_0115183284 /NCGR_PEP_ID=MMETSP0270-20121206/8376_1 /TAXON_ID=71861 /ORGANISM="Scrippsiella trochoidea, Strain CCMP3099" /LENGTH=107 /DNA_ID=CAMNT_0002596351 /DNA_START=9 /DNA_END=333 /DNA_ORIENTATION=+
MVTQGLVTRAHAPLEVAAKRRARMRRFMYLLQVLVAQPRRMENIQTARGRSANAQTVRIAAEAPGKIIPAWVDPVVHTLVHPLCSPSDEKKQSWTAHGYLLGAGMEI